jgi:hypothetical protein
LKGRLLVWLCTECWEEGIEPKPAECPSCGCRDAWYITTTDKAGPRPARALFEELLDGIFGPSKARH